jgi:hypothetical protein
MCRRGTTRRRSTCSKLPKKHHGLFEEALDLALAEEDRGLANADFANTNDERKKLWLRVAQQVLKTKQDISKAMAVLSGNDLVKIEDILPFFPDFTKIDHFQNAIFSSLEDCNVVIENLMQEMNLATASSKAIWADMDELRQGYSVMQGGELCRVSSLPLLSWLFHKFSCGCRIITERLIEYVRGNLPRFKGESSSGSRISSRPGCRRSKRPS